MRFNASNFQQEGTRRGLLSGNGVHLLVHRRIPHPPRHVPGQEGVPEDDANVGRRARHLAVLPRPRVSRRGRPPHSQTPLRPPIVPRFPRLSLLLRPPGVHPNHQGQFPRTLPAHLHLHHPRHHVRLVGLLRGEGRTRHEILHHLRLVLVVTHHHDDRRLRRGHANDAARQVGGVRVRAQRRAHDGAARVGGRE